MTFITFFILYILVSLSLQKIATKLGETRAWMAWVPLAQEILVLKLAEKSWKWIFLFLVPLVNIWVSWTVWSKIATKLNRNVWFGRLMIVPFLNFWILIVLGFEINLRDLWSKIKEFGKKLLTKKSSEQLAAP
jgi:hypothetical protein